MNNRLTKNSITLKELFALSVFEYRTRVDNKKDRARVDIIGGKIVARKNLQYNPSTKKFEQIGREVKFEFLIRSDPKSYEKTDTVKIHRYPCVILFKDFSKGFNSPVRLRTGSLKKPLFPKKQIKDAGLLSEAKNEKEKEAIRKKQDIIRKENLRITNQNILNMRQMNFFFMLEWVYKQYGILYGPCHAKWSPKVTNKQLTPYLDKTMFYVCWKILPIIFRNPKLRQSFGDMSDARIV